MTGLNRNRLQRMAVPCPSIALNNLGLDRLTKLTHPKRKTHKKKKPDLNR